MDNQQAPLGVLIAAANDHGSQHIERRIDAAAVELPKNIPLIYDKAAASDPLRDRPASRGMGLIAPRRAHRKQRRPIHYQHKRRLKQRWKIERTNAWLHRYGRIAFRKDRRADMFLGWVPLACLFTILQRF
jgi:transposase